MLTHKDHFHGSDLEKIEKIYGIPKESITSFSANVNPLGISTRLRKELADHLDRISSYPDRDYTKLRQSIADYAKTRPEFIIVGNGTTELISLFIQVTHPKQALILGPTYSEYEHAVSLEGGATRYFPLDPEEDFQMKIGRLKEKLTDEIDLLVLCNPNNPTSTCICAEEMRQVLDTCKEHGIRVLVDETYIEFAPDYEKKTAIPLTEFYNNIIILRSTSKFFAAPGLRLGYAITGDLDLLQDISRFKNPWMINSLAEVAGELMFTDQEYISKTRSLIDGERRRMYQAFLASDQYRAYEPSANFMLVQILDEKENSQSLFDRCIRQGLMIRDCSTFPFLSDRYIRFCFMNPEDNDRLMEQLL